MIHHFRRGKTLLKIDDTNFKLNQDGTKSFEVQSSHITHGLEYVYFKRAYSFDDLIKNLEYEYFKKEFWK